MNNNNSFNVPSPSHRRPPMEVERQSAAVAAVPLLALVMDALPDGMVVLNAERQIVYSNRAFTTLAGAEQEQGGRVIGQRPGEAVGCIQVDHGTDGCGTSAHCVHCGVLAGVLNSLDGIPDAQESRIRLQSGHELDVQVWTTPFDHEGLRFTLLCFVDKRGTERHRVLDRLFFHDLLSRPDGLRGLLDIMAEKAPLGRPETFDFARQVVSLSAAVMDEVEALEELEAAEKGALTVSRDEIPSRQLLIEVADLHRSHRAARNKHVAVDPATADVFLSSDRRLLRRILGQMVRNALEASRHGECVTLRCLKMDDEVDFEVHNPAFMPRKIQETVFRRSATLHGMERGLGTYSVKLLAERCLGGQVSFSTDRRKGTTFRVRLPRA